MSVDPQQTVVGEHVNRTPQRHIRANALRLHVVNSAGAWIWVADVIYPDLLGAIMYVVLLLKIWDVVVV